MMDWILSSWQNTNMIKEQYLIFLSERYTKEIEAISLRLLSTTMAMKPYV